MARAAGGYHTYIASRVVNGNYGVSSGVLSETRGARTAAWLIITAATLLRALLCVLEFARMCRSLLELNYTVLLGGW